MNQVARLKTAQEFYDFWHIRLSNRQAESLDNVKKACDAMVGMGAQRKMNAASIGDYCKEILNVSPTEQTIRNMKVMDDGGNKVGVYLEYIRLRAGEFQRRGRRGIKKEEKLKAPSYLELADSIIDPDTKTWVKNLIREMNMVEGACKYLEEQIRQMSKEVGGLDVAGAIEAGPTNENPMNLPVIGTNAPVVNTSMDLVDAIKTILRLPMNDDVPHLQLNDKGALVFDDGFTGAVVVLNSKQWAAVKAAVEVDNNVE